MYDMTEGWNSLAAELLLASMEDGLSDQELSFYEDRIRENGGLALDQACGTGRHILPLLQRGLEVHGADVSDDALRLARREAELRGLHPTLFHQRMEECDLPHEYGTIYVANGTFQILVDRVLARDTLERFLRHLSPGGQLLVELFVPPEVTQGPRINDKQHPTKWGPTACRGGDGEIVTFLWTEELNPAERTLVSSRRYELYLNGELSRTEVHSHPLRWYLKDEFATMLEHTGYAEVQYYTNHEAENASGDLSFYVCAARRHRN